MSCFDCYGFKTDDKINAGDFFFKKQWSQVVVFPFLTVGEPASNHINVASYFLGLVKECLCYTFIYLYIIFFILEVCSDFTKRKYENIHIYNYHFQSKTDKSKLSFRVNHLIVST